MSKRVQVIEPSALNGAPIATTRLHPRPILSPKVIHIDHPHREERRRVEAFVENAYARVYGGRLPRHYPTLMSVQDQSGRIYAVVGFRLARDERLFLEQYLDAPVEQALAAATRDDTHAREHIAEVGNLASDGRGATIFLFLALAAHLRALGCRHAVATATRQLRGIFAKCGLTTVELAPADPVRLPDHGAAWGTYYETDPLVLAGSITDFAGLPGTSSAACDDTHALLRSRLHFRTAQA